MKLRPKSAAGFTLLEIILAVGIGVIFMGGAVVFLSTTGGDRELIQSRKMLEEEVGSAREKALGTGIRQQILLDVRAVAGNEFPGEVEMDLITPEDLARGRRGWGKPEKYQWLITGGGLVEPIRVRLRHGENRDEFEFNALTGESNTRRQSQP
jgi:type II secretory pathway pseudopilin PulG